MKKGQRKKTPDAYVPLAWNVVLDILSGKRRGKLPEDFYGPGLMPTDPTKALPGSEEKIVIMSMRYERREMLFHKRDAWE